jgi:hypothetical protein
MEPNADYVWRVQCCGEIFYRGLDGREAQDWYDFLTDYNPTHSPVLEHLPLSPDGRSAP